MIIIILHLYIPEEVETSCVKGIFAYPKGESVWAQMWWWYTLPIRFLLGITIPSPITCRTFYPFAFFMCIVWIGVNSYVVSWCMTVLGMYNFINQSTILIFCDVDICNIYILFQNFNTTGVKILNQNMNINNNRQFVMVLLNIHVKT